MNVIIVHYGLHLLAEGAVEFLFSSPSDNGAILRHITVMLQLREKWGHQRGSRTIWPTVCSESAAKSRQKWRRVECDRKRRGN